MVTEADILDVLRTINDPEMPISIVDLGIVERVSLEARGGVTVDLLPTFVGCPALEVVRREVIEKLSRMGGVREVRVNFVYEPAWSPERISPGGKNALAAVGITVPHVAGETGLVELRTSPPGAAACPFCGSERVELESTFGPTRCKMIYYCTGCGSSFEHLKQLN